MRDEKIPEWLEVLIIVLILAGIVLFMWRPWEPDVPPPEPPPKPKIELPDAGKVGERVGDTTGRFGKGFWKGVRGKSTQP